MTSSPGGGDPDGGEFRRRLSDEGAVLCHRTIGDKSFTMFTQGDSAWLVNKADEPRPARRHEGRERDGVKGVSRRGNKTTYNYSLAGVTAAADKMIAECK